MAIPTDIAGLWGWWKADAISGSDGELIETWPDSSGNARDLTPGEATLETNELNGLPIMRFDGINDYFDMPSLAALTAGTVFLLVKISADPPGTDEQTGLWRGGSHVEAVHYPYTDGNIYDGWGSTVRKNTGNPALTLASWRTYCVRSATNDWTSFLDGTQHFTTGTNTVGFTATPAFGGSVAPYYLQGDAAELFIFDSALSVGDRQSMEAYLTSKWFGGPVVAWLTA